MIKGRTEVKIGRGYNNNHENYFGVKSMTMCGIVGVQVQALVSEVVVPGHHVQLRLGYFRLKCCSFQAQHFLWSLQYKNGSEISEVVGPVCEEVLRKNKTKQKKPCS